MFRTLIHDRWFRIGVAISAIAFAVFAFTRPVDAQTCVPDFQHSCGSATAPPTTQWPPCTFEKPIQLEDGSCVSVSYGAPGPTTPPPDITPPPFGSGEFTAAHCGTPQAEPTCPTTTTHPTTTLPPTTTTIATHICRPWASGGYKVPIDQPCPPPTDYECGAPNPPEGCPPREGPPPTLPPRCVPKLGDVDQYCNAPTTTVPETPTSVVAPPETSPPVSSPPTTAASQPRTPSTTVALPTHLPVTGAASTDSALAGVLFVLGGIVLVVRARRRPVS